MKTHPVILHFACDLLFFYGFGLVTNSNNLFESVEQQGSVSIEHWFDWTKDPPKRVQVLYVGYLALCYICLYGANRHDSFNLWLCVAFGGFYNRVWWNWASEKQCFSFMMIHPLLSRNLEVENHISFRCCVFMAREFLILLTII